jgi:hypothetical protein
MAALTVVAADVALATKGGESHEIITAPAAEAITAGQIVRWTTTTGTLALGNGTTAPESQIVGVAISEANQAGITITAVRKGVVDLGDALDALAFNAVVYASDTDGTLGDAAGTVSKVVGEVIPAFGATTADKLLRVNL